MATAGVSIASAVVEEGVTSRAAETAVGMLMQAIVDQRQSALAAVTVAAMP
jgi:hypothetical protein